MIISWNWLKQYVALEISVEELAHRLTMSGLNHESTGEVEGDLAIDFEVTSNRPDCLGHIGIAREAAVVLDRPLSIPEVRYRTALPSACEVTRVDVACPDLCPRYTARVIRGVKIGPSPDWLRRRLATCGVASINNVVDITNYVLLEVSQPLHAFDFDKLVERRIEVRRARPGESIVAINQKRYELSGDTCVIADGGRAVAVAGVMGGYDTEVSDSTVNLLIESAEFDPMTVRRTARALGLHSESSYRFERGVDPAGLEWASRRCCQLIVELAGGTVAEGHVSFGAAAEPRAPIALRFAQLKRILGIDIDPDLARTLLKKLGIAEVSHGADRVEVRPPSWRRDLEREIDLVEEVGRLHGYEHIPEDREVPMTTAPRTARERVEAAIRNTLAALEMHEAVTMSFVDQPTAACFTVWADRSPLCVNHSSRRQENALRQSLVPSLLNARRLNESRGNVACDLYELANVYIARDGQAGTSEQAALPDERMHLAMVVGRGLRELKGAMESLLVQLHAVNRLEIRPCDRREFRAGHGGALWLGQEHLGFIGELSAAVVNRFDLRAACSVAELRVDVLAAAARLIPQYQPVPHLPASLRELSLIVDDTLAWSEIESLVRSEAGKLLESIEFLDLYRGKPIPKGRKSLHFAMTYRAADRTLTHDEVEQSQQAIIAACRARFHAELRGA